MPADPVSHPHIDGEEIVGQSVMEWLLSCQEWFGFHLHCLLPPNNCTNMHFESPIPPLLIFDSILLTITMQSLLPPLSTMATHFSYQEKNLHISLRYKFSDQTQYA